MEPPEAPHFRFGVFKTDPASGELWKNGRRVRVQELPFRVLILLLERADTVVSREELQKTLWPADTYVEFDQGLNTAVKKLREALGDSADNPRFIETLPRKGYRFIAPVTGGAAAAPAPQRPERKRYWALIALGAVAATGTAAWLVRTRPAPSPPSPVLLTSYAGVETGPSFSPDGQRVAFTWNGENEDNFDIYVKQIGAEKPVRLTTDPARDFGPAWSPDGRLIAFGRVLNAERTAVLLTPSAGGPEVKVTEVPTPAVWEWLPFLAWSPDGKWLAVSDLDVTAQSGAALPRTDGFRPKSLFLVSIDTGERRRLTSQIEGRSVDSGPAFSPDGGTLAFVRNVTLGPSDLYLLPLSREFTSAGRLRHLTGGNQRCASPAWTRDGRELVFAAGQRNDMRLWRIPASGPGPARPLEFAEHTASPAISRQGRLAYAQASVDQNIWRIELAAPGVAAGAAKRFLASTRTDANPQFSPDGKRIVFVSNRNGSPEIWIANADGSDPAPLTSMHADTTGGPNWSPDGSHVVFDSNKEGQFEVYVIGAAGGTPRRLTANPAVDGVPSWSRDGASIYFVSGRSGGWQVWKMPAGGGQAVQVTRKGGYVTAESPDGRFVYYSGSGSAPSGVWRMPTGGGEEMEVLPSVTFLNFAVTRDGIYFIPRAENGRHAIHFFRFATGNSSPVAPLSAEMGFGLAVSPDGRTLLYTQTDHRGSDLMLVEDFR